MAQAKKGDRVKINFTGKLEDGTVFDTTLEDECGCDDCGCEEGPMEFTLGEEEFFAQVEDALVGMAPGEKKAVTVPAADAFGEHDEGAVFSVDCDQIPGDLKPEVDQELELTGEDDESFVVTVVEVTDEQVTFDANHPLAGEDLKYEIELLEIL
ncbi:FKBP-type peptidyl-prolyl cis-trans isomerase [uncultured Desulfuromonas sp.]|uniref:FKBP-type peptidyl-prolyl cis-trans isomerase n=1 Tax=uncultured Desulfuromonas sp. TaxID=181013 RepID=UPI00260594E7|nr:FKBP-type peptidyl-prolyl cis-trans isomerase [uncultured Desulfuromonas sp.]